ncbi:hypothetical protein DITRI_Ditri17bG0003600 [Diplodiscus trichospermus]
MKIFNSFANALSLLRNSDEVSQNPRNNNNMKSRCRRDVDQKSEGLGESIKSSATMQKDPRGCSKRRKCAISWTRDTPTLIDDGRAWRKYGQKAILHANHTSFANNNNLTNKYDNPFLSSFQSVKQESKEDHVFDSLADQPRTFESLAQMTVSSSADHSAEDAIFGMLESVDLDQLLEF